MRDETVGPVILDLEGVELTPEESELLSHPNVGGVIFFSRNYETPEQLSHLARQIRVKFPHLLLCVDQEGGRVQRFVNGLTKLPKLQLLGEIADKESFSSSKWSYLMEQLGYLMAMEVRSLGVDLSFAPVLDCDKGISNVIMGRAFHRDPNKVSQFASAYVRGMNKAGMQATGKHFPGHGSVALDSHLTLPEDDREWNTIMEEDIIPFRALIQEGIAGIMPAHIVYPKVDSLPVGFSSHWLKKVLRQDLGFEGAIISDCLSMEGARIIGDYPTRACTALSAGCDFVLICNNRIGAIAALEANLQSDSKSYSRRIKLFPTKQAIPTWPELMQTPDWKEAHRVLEELNEE